MDCCSRELINIFVSVLRIIPFCPSSGLLSIMPFIFFSDSLASKFYIDISLSIFLSFSLSVSFPLVHEPSSCD